MFWTNIDEEMRFSSENHLWKILALLGSALLLSAVLIFVMPELVAYVFAAALFWLGLTAIVAAFRMRRRSRAPQFVKREYYW